MHPSFFQDGEAVVGSAGISLAGAILVAEDSQDDMFLLSRAWAATRQTILLAQAREGAEAMELLLESLRIRPPSLPGLVLADLSLPRVSGFELLRFIKETPGLKDITVLVWSNSANIEDLRRAYNLGAHAYLPKPASTDGWRTLAERLRNFYTWQAATERK